MAASATFPFRKALAPLSLFFLFVYPAWCVSSQQITGEFDFYRFPNFNSTTTKELAFCPSATYDHGSLQVGGGTVVLDDKYVTVPPLSYYGDFMSSFSTVFDMSISLDPNRTEANSSVDGDGLSFVIFQSFRSLENWSVDYSICSNLSHLVAVDFDAQNNKMAFRSLLRNTSIWLNNSGVELFSTGERMLNHTVWIDFDAPFSEQGIQVYIANQGNPKPRKPVLSVDAQTAHHILGSSKRGLYNNLSRDDVLDVIYFGFSGLNENSGLKPKTVQSWMLAVGLGPRRVQKSGWKDLALQLFLSSTILLVGVVMLLSVVVLLVRCLLKKKHETDFLGKALRSLPGMPKEFKYAELRKATNKFSADNKLGQGGFGEVYKGKLPKEQTLVAVKAFLREADQGGFLEELTIINRLRHRNLVRLIGWSHQNKKLLLVYDYMPNGSLDKHLFYNQDEITLPWNRRYNILADVALALHYLHNEYNQKVVHRDIKASNIMLDADFNAYLGDFGLAKAIDNGLTSYVDGEMKGVPGTWGYMAPESLLMGKATRETDVYGFGAVVLETVSGHRPSAKIGKFSLLVDWIWTLHREEQILMAVDTRLGNEYDVNEAHRLLLLGLACSHPIPSARPKAHEILQIISKSVAPPIVPLEKPAFMCSSMSFDDDGTNALNALVSDESPLFFSYDDNNGRSTMGGNTSHYYTCDLPQSLP